MDGLARSAEEAWLQAGPCWLDDCDGAGKLQEEGGDCVCDWSLLATDLGEA